VRMRRRFFAIFSVLITAIVLVSLVPGCEPAEERCNIVVKATLCDAPWEGAVDYTLTGPGTTSAPLTGTNVTASFDDVECGNWTCAYVSGGPPGAYFVDITPSPTQSVSGGDTITFTLNFELEQDASIEVKATLCGEVYEGAVAYSLSTEGEGLVHNVEVPASATVAPGEWTCNVSFNPPGAYFVDITPSPTQSVSGGDTITFTLNFELEQDASIEFLTWTINGQNVTPNTPQTPYELSLGDVIDVHYAQHVDGCQGEVVEVNEKSELSIQYTLGAMPVWFVDTNHWCAVVKEPEPIEKVSQVVSLNGFPTPLDPFDLYPYEAAILGVETIWLLEKEKDYTKTINWLGISSEPGLNECVLFELIPEFVLTYFTLVSSAQVELVDDEEVNPEIAYAESPPLYLAR